MMNWLKVTFLTVICASIVACGGGSGDSGFLGGAGTDDPLTIVTTNLPDLAAVPYAEILEATGGRAPYSWAMVDDDGTGLTLDDGGVLRAETGFNPGQYAITVSVTDNAGRRVERSLLIQVTLAPLAIATTALPEAESGAAYSAVLVAEGGTPPLSWELLSDGGTGLAIPDAEQGLLTGVPSITPGVYGLTVKLTDAGGLAAQRSLLLTVAGDTPGPLEISTSSLPGAELGVRYAAVLEATGGSGDYFWSLVSDGLSGLDLSEEGVLSGLPSRSGTLGLTFEVNDGFTIAIRSLVVTVDDPTEPPEPVEVTPTPLEAAVPGVPYAAVLEATGGTGSYTWSLRDGGGSGLSLSSAGVLSGVPAAQGVFGIVVRATSAGDSDDQAFTLRVGPETPGDELLSISTEALPSGTESESYAVILRAFGGDGDYTWSVREDGGSGLVFRSDNGDNNAGLLTSSSLPGAGDFSLQIEVRDGGSNIDIKEFTLTVNP